jgi:hypothetical protein
MIYFDPHDYPNMIRITSVPSGEAPLEIREEWVGIQMCASEPLTDISVGVVTGTAMGPGTAYAVPTRLALLYLIAQGKEDAALWWHDMLPLEAIVTGQLYFGVDEIEISEGFGEEGINLGLDLNKFFRLQPNYPFEATPGFNPEGKIPF